MLRTATEEPQTNLAQTIASNLEAVIDPAAVPVLVIVQAEEALAQVIVPAEGLAPVIVRAVAQERETGLAAVPVLVIVQVEEVQGLLIVPAEVRAQAIVLAEAELERVQAEVELELVPVAAELELVLAEAELELARAVAELELGPVEAEREPDQVAVALRIKLVIAVRPRDLVPRLVAAEDLAAEVETTRDPAATEAATAWEAAV